MKATAIFDIGRTNKKFFLFDKNYQEVYKEYSRFEEIEDDDGYPSDDLQSIQSWLNQTFRQIQDLEYKVDRINFSTYGASFVHIDRYGQPVTPLYNYTKPFPKELLDRFYSQYGDPLDFGRQTASPPLGMLNSGLQLYWLKYAKPELFARIRYSLHLPQYISYLFTGLPLSEYTSIGCHTGLWDFTKNDYHDWVYAEGIDRILPPIVSTGTSINKDYQGQKLRIGVGIHDSSSALLPYIRADHKPFLLISTGTWSISINPFDEQPLTDEELSNDTLQFMRIDGKPVKATRLFLGNEYKLQVEKLCAYFGKEYGYHREVKFDETLYHQIAQNYQPKFHFESIQLTRNQPTFSRLAAFEHFEVAFHQLMYELMELQLQAAQRAIGDTPIKKIYIDGGFADNDIFVKLSSYYFKDYKLRTTQSPLGSALGAALVISDNKIGNKFLKKHYAMRKHAPLILDQ